MPNGGSDCCGTCWFNSENHGEPGYHNRETDVQVRCTIRDVDIQNPFWTYCANHPHHNPDHFEFPIGPIYTDSGEGFPYRRQMLVESPDGEEIRLKLLELLQGIEETPTEEYPSPTQRDETVIDQLGMFGERRALDDLHRIVRFEPFATSPKENSIPRNRISTIARAIESLARILGDEALTEIERCLNLGLNAARRIEVYSRDMDPLSWIRYRAVASLQHCSKSRRERLLLLARDDPDVSVADAAQEMLKAE